MTRYTRRGALAAGASTLAALSGCSSLPFVGNGGNSLPDYDWLDLSEAVRGSRVPPVEAYPGPVPSSLLVTHRQRAETLLESVPESPSFPNTAISEDLRQDRERVADRLADRSTPDDPSPGDLDDLEYLRRSTADVAFAYRAASGDFDAADAASWRERVRDDYRSLHSERTYTGSTPAEAVVAASTLEAGLADARLSIEPDRAFPANPKQAPFTAGELAGELEDADAALATVRGLSDARRDDTGTDHWNAVVSASGVLAGAYEATRDEHAPYLSEQSRLRDVVGDRSVEDTPRAELFRLGESNAIRGKRTAEEAASRGDYATALLAYVRGLVGTLATARSVEAVRDGDHGVPPDAAAVEARRTAAVDALRDARAAEPAVLASAAADPLWHVLDDADDRLVDGPTNLGVVHAAGKYAYVEYAAGALPNVVDRAATELQRANDE